MQRHRLGTQAGGVAAMKAMCDLLEIGIDPKSTFLEYTDSVGTDLNGARVEAGFPVANWTWDVMPQKDFDRLLAFVSASTGYATVYIRTRNNSGASGYDFDNYTAIMQRPKAGTREGLLMRNISVEFTTLVAA